MAVFFTNVCKFQNCGIVFPTLYNLIEHIEEYHIDFNSKISSVGNLSPYDFIPLSRILRYSSCRRVNNNDNNQKTTFSTRKKAPIRPSENDKFLTKFVEDDDDDVVNILDENPTSMYNNSSSNYSSSCSSCTSSNGSLSSSPSNGSKFSTSNAQKINKYNLVDPMEVPYTNFKNIGKVTTGKKPYSCTVPGCIKTYKHANGIRYHNKVGHCSFDKKLKTNRKQMNFPDCTTFSNDLKYNNFTMCKPSEEFSFGMDARNRNISEHGYSTPYCNGPMLPPYFLKTKVPYYI